MSKGKYIRTQEFRKKASEDRKGNKNYWFGKKRLDITGENSFSKRPEVRKKMSESKKGKKLPDRLAEKNPSWNGGGYNYWHDRAFELFGKNNCEHCNITLMECKELYNRRFDMHNLLTPKDYTVMESYVWQCLCKSCHSKIGD